MTAPLTPSDCDLRDFGFMPLDVRRFRDSDLVSLEDPEAIVAAVLLWGAAWHQIPAASLPDDDRVLAQLAGFGKVVKEWVKVRSGALRGFVKCSDGRLYHPVVAAKAKEAWEGKQKQRHRTFLATIRKHNERNPEMQLDAPSYEAWLQASKPTTIAEVILQPIREPLLPLEKDEMSRGHDDNVTRDTKESHAQVTHDKASKGKGQGEGQGQGDSKVVPIPPAELTEEEAREDLMGLTARLCRAAGVSVIQPSKLSRAMDVVKAWVKDGIPEELALDVIAKRVDDMPESDNAWSLAYFDGPIRKAFAKKGRKPTKPSAPPPVLDVPDDDDPRVVQLRERLLKDFGRQAYDGWLNPKQTAVQINGTSVTLTAATPFMRDWIAGNMIEPLERHAQELFGDVDVRIKA